MSEQQKQIDDGGPAFPQPMMEGVSPMDSWSMGTGGLSLRDYFAAKALTLGAGVWPGGSIPHNAKGIAEKCYAVADAMLAHRHIAHLLPRTHEPSHGVKQAEGEHTPEPWKAEGRVVHALNNHRYPVNRMEAWVQGGWTDEPGVRTGMAELEANARRIVACVNACQGIADPAALRRERDELREALEQSSKRNVAEAEIVWSAEVSKMRAALEQIAGGWAEPHTQKIARAALSPVIAPDQAGQGGE